jgi:hypothetical protein
MEFSEHELVRRHAYHVWERLGCPDGRDEEIWELAVKEINGQAVPQIDQGPFQAAQEDRAAADPTSDEARTNAGADERRADLKRKAATGLAKAAGRKSGKGSDSK